MNNMKMLSLSLILLISGLAQPTRRVEPLNGPRRVALIIGNNAYPWGRLTNAIADARAVKSALRSVGFDAANIILKSKRRRRVA